MGDTVDNGLMYSSGNGGSENGHLGNGANEFFPGTEGFLGFTTNGNYGWMGAILSANAGGTLVDWAYEDGGGSIAAGNIRQAAPGGGVSVWTLTANGAESPTLGSVIADGGGYTSNVVKTGTGTWTLGATNTYTGTTMVNQGTLLVNGNNSAATGAVTVNNSGSTLGGTGTIGGAVTINANARITGAAAGSDSIGALTLQNNVTFNGADASNLATYFVDIAAGVNNSDRLTIGGILDLTNTFDQILFSGTPDGTSSYILATATGGINGTFDFGSAPAGYQFFYGADELDLVPVPEPATWTAGLLTLAALGYTQRRRIFKRKSHAGLTTS